MEENSDERLSALVDGALTGAELKRGLDHLCRDAAARGRWERYHLIGDGLRQNLPDSVGADVSARVAAALEREPVVLAPRRKVTLPPGLMRQAAGLATAASVTAVAILGIQQMQTGAGEPVQVAKAERSAPRAEPALAETTRRQLDAYLVNHTEYSSTSGMYGVLPYVRIVSDR